MVKWIVQFWLCIYVCLLIPEWKAHAQSHPDIYLTLEQRIKRHGYPVEIHEVTTEDGYILSIYRIPHGLKKYDGKNKGVVLMLHGMGGAPHHWLLLGTKDSLPYYLADRGFDVWLGTVRGAVSAFKRQHVKYDWNKDPQYFDFCLHEMGKYDLPANIDYILSHTDQSKLFFIGHSAGTAIFFVLLSEKPEYNEKIRIGVQYASAPILKYMDYAPAVLLSSLSKVWKGLFKYLGMTDLFSPLRNFVPTIITACQDPSMLKICLNVVGIIGTHNSILMDENIAALAATAFPRVSIKLLMHFADNVNDGDFKQYNYGTKKNMLIYGQNEPPRYNLSSCIVPVAFFYSAWDSLCVKEDVYFSANLLPNVVLIYEVPFLKYSHADFIVARNSTYLLYEPTYKLFKDYDDGILPAKIGNVPVPNK